jgi:hypothetical protein
MMIAMTTIAPPATIIRRRVGSENLPPAKCCSPLFMRHHVDG